MRATKLAVVFLALCATLLNACGGGGGSTTPASTPPTTPPVQPPPRTPETVLFIADLNTVGQFELFRTRDDRADPIRVNADLAPNGDVFGFALSPDKQWIAFTAGAAVGTQIHLFAAPISGGTPTQLSVMPNGFSNVSRFVWSPDSTRIVYEVDSDIDGVTELFLVSRDGSGNRKINGSVGSTVETTNPVWSDDSRFIAYEVRQRQVANQLGSTLAIVGINTHDTTATVLGGLPNSVRVSLTVSGAQAAAGRSIKHFQWSSLSNLIAYSGDLGLVVGRDEIYTATPGVTGSTANNRKISTTRGGFDGVKAFSFAPDGIKMAYNAVINLSGATGVIFDNINIVTDVTAATLDEIITTLAPTTSNNRILIDQFWWSPDSNFVAFDADPDIANREELYVTNVAARSTTRVSTPPVPAGNRFILGTVEWSGNSQLLAYRANTSPTRAELYSVRPDGSQHMTVSTVANPSGAVNFFRWSHDSQSLVFHGDLDTESVFELYVAAQDGSNQRKISPTITPSATAFGVSDRPLWSCDNQRIIYTIRQLPTSLPELNSSLANPGPLGGTGDDRLHPPLSGSQFVMSFSGCPVAKTFGAGN